MLYTARMRHGPETVRRFTALQYNTFEPGRKLLMLALSAGCMLLGLASGSAMLAVPCFFVGALLLTNLNARANAVADGVIEAMGGSFPELVYFFGEDAFRDGEERPAVPYEKLIRLIEDGEYLYLFVSKASGYMLSRSSVEGEGGCEGLMRFLAEKSGLMWTKPVSLWTLRLRDLWGIRRK